MSRWGGALGLGAGVTAAAIAFGSRPLAVVGVGLLLAGGLARLWAAFARSPITLEAAVRPPRCTEGDRVHVSLRATRASRVPVGSAAVSWELGPLGLRECRLRGHGRVLRAELDLGRLPRGVYRPASTQVLAGDFLGLASVLAPTSCELGPLLVRPRIEELAALFTDSGLARGDARRGLLRRSSGFDFHSVREYEQGESLRRVHWPTSARRGQLMVRELEDTVRDGVVVLLDCDPAGAAGTPPDSSFDAAVRAAGSLVRAHAGRGRVATLVTTGRERALVAVRSVDADLDGALAALAAAAPDAVHGLARWLGGDGSWLSGAGELVVVTAELPPAAASALLALSRRVAVAVVRVDAPTFAGRPPRTDAGALSLSAAGIPVAVLRHGQPLAEALGAVGEEVSAVG